MGDAGEEAMETVELKELLKLFPANGLSQVFNKIDTDKSGGIDKDELKAALEKLPKPKSVKAGKKKSLDELFQAFDEDGNGTIDPEEWVKNMPLALKASIVESLLAEAEGTVCPIPVKCKLPELPAEVKKAIGAGLTPLVVDNTETKMVDTFISYGKSLYDESAGGVLFDAKRMALMTTLHKKPVEEVLDEFRKPVIDAISAGKNLVIACQTAVPDFKGKFNGPKTVPLDLFVAGGRAMISDASKVEALVRDDDPPERRVVEASGKRFAVVITTGFSEDEYKKYLFADDYGLPGAFEAYQPIIIIED